MSYKILFIDEDPAQLREFQRFIKKQGDNNLQVKAISPPDDIYEILEEMEEEKIDVIICDFDLKEKNNTPYFGDEVIDIVLEHKPNFPVFIFTSHEGDALSHSTSVHYIYDKQAMDSTSEQGKRFIERVKQEIQNYHNMLDEMKKNFNELKAKMHSKSLSPKEEERLIELDNRLEEMVGGKKLSIAKHIKDTQDKRLEALIKTTKELIDKIDKNI